MKYGIVLLLIFAIFIPSATSAVTSDFNIRAFVGDDITPPSTPALLAAMPVAQTQIDVDWGTSTDNWILGGYVLLRDGLPIATTTLTNYSDTGLTPATLYNYEVYAFDTANNISSTSNSLATSTFAVPVTPTTTPAVSKPPSGTQILMLENFSSTENETSVNLAWDTNMPSRFTLRWGRTDTYNGGYIESDVYQLNHKTIISDLEPGTVYLFELIGHSALGRTVLLKTGEFTTATREANRIVPNVERLVAEVVKTDVRLQFALPATEVGARVRVVRSHFGWPASPYDGAIIFEGNANEIWDRQALRDHKVQYYTVFVIGEDGSLSSGAVVVARWVADTEMGTGEGEEKDDKVVVPIQPEPEILLPLLSEDEIVIKQGDNIFTFLTEAIALSYHEPFSISISKDALPKHLKVIIVTLLDPTDQRQSYSFLLRINKDGTAYEAMIAPLEVAGTSRLQVEVFDFEQLVVGRYRKQIDFVLTEKITPTVVFPDALIQPFKNTSGFIFGTGVFALFIWLFFWRRGRKTEDKL